MKAGDIVRIQRDHSRYYPNVGMIIEMKGIMNRRIGIANFQKGDCASVLLGGKVYTFFTDTLEVVHEAR